MAMVFRNIQLIMALIFLFISLDEVRGQRNFVPNPGFEEYQTCDYDWGLTPLQNILPGWSKVLYSPFYANHICYQDPASGISSEIYLAPARFGQGYMNLVFAETSGISFEPLRTYMQCRLSEPLRPDRDYYLSYYISNHLQESVPTVSHWGVLFSNEYIVEQNTGIRFGILNREPQIEFDTVPLTFYGQWDKYEHCFRPDSQFTVMTVGHFRENSETSGTDKLIENRAFLSIDQFYLTEIESEVRLEQSRDTVCVGDCVTFSSNHSLIPGQFRWSVPGGHVESSADSVVTVCYTEPGTYDVQLEVEHCTGRYEGVFNNAITVLPEVTYTPIDDMTICFGDTLYVDITSPYNWVWQDSVRGSKRIFTEAQSYTYTVENGFCQKTDSFILDYAIVPEVVNEIYFSCPEDTVMYGDIVYNTPGIYEMTLKSVQGCDSVYVVLDYRHHLPRPLEIEGNLSYCPGDSATIDIKSDHSLLLWEDGSRQKKRTFTEPQTVTLEALDENNCLVKKSLQIEEYPQPRVETSDLTDVWYEKNLELPVDYEGSVQRYIWAPGSFLDCADCPYPKMISPYEGIFSIRAENEWGCYDEASVQVRFKRGHIFLPNIIKRQSDVNGIFYLRADFEGFYNIYVYDRWGNLIFQNRDARTNDPSDGWNPSSQYIQGVYVYKIEYEELGSTKIVTGDITLTD